MKYIKIYNQIIDRAKTRQIEGYTEKHHVIPKCLGGSNDKDNIVQLTAREHFLCHQLLCEIYPNNDKLKYALFLMAIGKNKKIKYIISSRVYEQLKIEYSKISKGKLKPEGFGDKIKNNKERKEKISKANKKPKPKGFGTNHSSKMKGKNQSKQTIENRIKKISKAIIQCDLNGNPIKKWNSAVEASKILKINKSMINAVARGNTNHKTAGKYKWIYENKN
jgi:hypothetical protein